MRNCLKKTAAAVAAVMLLFTASLAFAETKITVSGSGETQISADTALVTLGVEARDKDVLAAQQKANGVIAAIRDALTELGIPQDCVNTDYMNIYAVYDYDGDREQVMAYCASSSLAIRVTDMDKVGQVIDTAFTAGANTLNGISFSASDTEAAKAEALKKAVADAKAKAEILAEAAGLKITGTETISEGGTFSYDNDASNFTVRAMGKEGAADTATIVQASQLMVSANITIVFEAE